jgi:FkbM family methyltransferase
MKFEKNLLKISYKKIKFKIINSAFGAINVRRLLKLKSELELFNFYLKYRRYYSSFADVGANVGIHTLFASRIFKSVYSYECLNEHFILLKKNIKINNFRNIKIFEKAISINNKNQYLNVLTQNTTASHLTLSSRSKYGKILKKKVECISIKSLNGKINLIKLDVEGLESELIKKIDFSKKFSDFLIEVHNLKNAMIIFKKLSNYKNIFSYKLLKSKLTFIKNIKDMPISTSDGTLFISKLDFLK